MRGEPLPHLSWRSGFEASHCHISRFSKQRHNMLWRSPSTSNLSKRLTQMSIDEEPDSLDALDLETTLQDVGRPRSWSPTDDTSELLLKTRQLGKAIVLYLS